MKSHSKSAGWSWPPQPHLVDVQDEFSPATSAPLSVSSTGPSAIWPASTKSEISPTPTGETSQSQRPLSPIPSRRSSIKSNDLASLAVQVTTGKRSLSSTSIETSSITSEHQVPSEDMPYTITIKGSAAQAMTEVSDSESTKPANILVEKAIKTDQQPAGEGATTQAQQDESRVAVTGPSEKLLEPEEPPVIVEQAQDADLENKPARANGLVENSEESNSAVLARPSGLGQASKVSEVASVEKPMTAPVQETSRFPAGSREESLIPGTTRSSEMLQNHTVQTIPNVPTQSLTVILPPPQIVIQRATDDISNALVSVPGTPDIDRGEPPMDGDIDSLTPQYDLLRNLTARLAEHLDSPAIPEEQPHTGRRRHFLRKTRRIVMRGPVLKVLLGRELASQTQPVLKAMAEGEPYY